jgi:hypothetical protein
MPFPAASGITYKNRDRPHHRSNVLFGRAEWYRTSRFFLHLPCVVSTLNALAKFQQIQSFPLWSACQNVTGRRQRIPRFRETDT